MRSTSARVHVLVLVRPRAVAVLPVRAMIGHEKAFRTSDSEVPKSDAGEPNSLKSSREKPYSSPPLHQPNVFVSRHLETDAGDRRGSARRSARGGAARSGGRRTHPYRSSRTAYARFLSAQLSRHHLEHEQVARARAPARSQCPDTGAPRLRPHHSPPTARCSPSTLPTPMTKRMSMHTARSSGTGCA